MEVTSTGGNLEVAIVFEYRLHHNWMAFASWYSIRKLLPDAIVSLYCLRGIAKQQLFSWAKTLRYYTGEPPVSEGALVLSPDVMAVRDYKGNEVADVRSDEDVTFVSYLNGCGTFSMDGWLDRKPQGPFVMASRRFGTGSMGVNERLVLKAWESMAQTYAMLV